MPEPNDRSNLGEQADMSETSVERQEDSSMGANSTDESMGSEGVEDPRGSRQQGRENTDDSGESFNGQGGQKENEDAEEGTGYI